MIGLALLEDRLETLVRKSGFLSGRGRFFASRRFISGAMPSKRGEEEDSEGGGLVGGRVHRFSQVHGFVYFSSVHPLST